MKSVRTTTPRLSMTFIESYTQPETTDELYCSSGSDSDDNNGSDADGDRAKVEGEAVSLTEQKRRPSLVIAGDAQALDSVRTVHSPRAMGKKPTTTSPRYSPGYLAGATAPMPNLPASPRATSVQPPPSPLKRLNTNAPQTQQTTQNPWVDKLKGANNVIDIVGTIAMLIFSYRDCLNEPNECHEECMADPDIALPLPMLMTIISISMFAYYSRSRPTALIEWAQTTMAVSWIQRMAPLPAIALVISHERHLALLGDGATAALAAFLVSQRRRRFFCDGSGHWSMTFLAASVVALCVDLVAVDGGTMEPISIFIGIAVVLVAHLAVSKLRSLAKIDTDRSTDIDDAEVTTCKKTN